MNELSGIGVALVTPFRDGVVDYEAFSRLLKFIGPHVDYYVVMGTTGESPTVTPKEKREILKFTLDHSNGLPVVYGIGGNNTHIVLDEIKSTDLSRVSAILSVSPYYNRPSQEGLVAHYTAIANQSPCPVILYNVPARTGSNIQAETTIRLSQHPNIAGIKEASGDLEQIGKVIENTDSSFMMISGDDLLTPQIMNLGGTGVISVLANGVPAQFKAFITGKGGQTLIDTLRELNPLMYEEANPVGVKELLKLQNICNNEVRLPLVSASEGLSARIERCFKKLT